MYTLSIKNTILCSVIISAKLHEVIIQLKHRKVHTN